MQWNRLLSTARIDHLGQWVERDASERRAQWQRDHDRIVFSGAFRRLAVKTQVHPLSENDHVHTRLSHSLEVASVGRSLATRIGAWLASQGEIESEHTPADLGGLVQAACLAHDIGNPPFGHAGERAIRAYFEMHPAHLQGLSESERSDLTGFEGNAQGFRVLTRLERHWFDGGMRLTAATLGAFVKYPFTAHSVSGKNKRKHGINQSELGLMHDLTDSLGLIQRDAETWTRHPLVYLVEAADDICYALIDLEDAVELGHLSYNEVAGLMKELVDRGARRKLFEELIDDQDAKLELLRSAAIDALMHEAEARFIRHYDAIMRGDFNEDLLDSRHASAGEVIMRAKALARERVYVDQAKQSYEGQSTQVIQAVLAHLLSGAEALHEADGDGTLISSAERDAVARLGKFRPRPSDSKYVRLMRVTDHLSAMTDRFLLRTVDELDELGYLAAS